MYLILKCCYVELKKGIKELPYALLGTVVFVLILSTFAFCAAKILYSPEDITQSAVAVVTNDIEDSYLNLAMNLVSNMESTSLTLDFQIMSEEDALAALQKRQVIAILYLPDQLINGILYGTNPPIRVLLASDDSLSSVFLTEITLAGARLLSGAQADIYAAGEIYTALGRQEALSDAYNTINRFNLNYALNRDKLFVTDSTSLDGTSRTEVFYISTGILLLLLFLTTSFTAMLRREDKDFYRLLFSRNISSLQYLIAKVITFALFFFCIQLVFYMIALWLPVANQADFLRLRFNGSLMVFFILNSLFLSSYANLVFMITKDVPGGIIFSYCLSSLMVFCSGCIIPTAFFPRGIQKITGFFPTIYMHRGLSAMLEGKTITLITPYLCYPVICFILCYLVFCYRRRADRL